MARRKTTRNEPKEDPPDMIPDDVVNAIVFFHTQRLPKEKKVRIEVNAVDSPHRFFFNWLGPQYQSVFMETMDSLQFDYRSTNQVYAIPRKRLRMGMACVVKYLNVFFRGVIIDVNDDFVEVFTIDYGKKVITIMENYDTQPLFWMRRKFKSMPCQAIPGQLHTVFPKGLNWTQEAADFLLDQLADKEVMAEVARYELPGETVSMSLCDPDSDEVIELSLVNAGHADFVGERGLEMIDNEAVSQRIVDHFDAKRKAEEAQNRRAVEAEVVPRSVPPGFEAKVREPAKPITYDNMLEALDATSSSSAPSCASQEDLRTIGGPDGLSPLLAAEELSAAELPTALVRPSVRSESCAVASPDKGVADDERCEAAAEDDEVDESASSCASTVDRLLSIDTSKVVDPQEQALLREELQREMERLQLKMAALDVQILGSEGAACSGRGSEAPVLQAPRNSNFNPDAAPFVPRSRLPADAGSSADSSASSASVRAGQNALPAGTTHAATEGGGNGWAADNQQPALAPVQGGVSAANASFAQPKSSVVTSLMATNTMPPPNRNSVPFATSFFDQFVAAPPASLVANSAVAPTSKTHFLPNRMSAPTVDLEPPPGLSYPPASPYSPAQISQASLMVMPPPGFPHANPVFMTQYPGFATQAPYYQRPQQPPWSYN